ncbi:MAG: CDP-alcohol phosphatidyltransferase family protein [Ruminococcus sp.]|nr:CDP-alcohol phosphatidyltransferase family protein [Ruminococcus sp.]
MEKVLIGKYDKSVLLTYISAVSAVIGCAAAMQAAFTTAIVCLVLSGVCDMFDGKVARMCQRDDTGKAFGVQIDSLADVVAFLVLPSVYGSVMTISLPHWSKSVFILYILTGLIRLAWFNVHATLDKPVEFYTGLPVTSAAIIFPLLHLIGFFIPHEIMHALVTATAAAMAVLFVARVRVPKFTGAWYVVCSVAAVLLIAAFVILRCVRL